MDQNNVWQPNIRIKTKNGLCLFCWLVLERPNVDGSVPPQYDRGPLGLLICGFGQIGMNMKITVLMPDT